jgi:hypothetical protein
MPLPVSMIREGRCYAVVVNRVRHVLKIEKGAVTYTEKFTTAESGQSGTSCTKDYSLERFAREAEREVPYN